MIARISGILAAFAVMSCGAEKSPESGKSSPGPEPAAQLSEEPSTPAPEPLLMGKSELVGYAYSRGAGRRAFRRCNKQHGELLFEEAVVSCREALTRDPGHLEASWILASSLVALGRFDDSVDPLSAAVAGDFVRWGKRSVSDGALEKFLASAAGGRFRELHGEYSVRFARAVQRGLLVVGRRGRPWYPKKKGPTSVNHRSEIYAYDLATGRYLRLSRTNASLVGFVRSPTDAELGYASYRRVWVPPAGDDTAPYIRELRIGSVALTPPSSSAKQVVIERVQWAEIGYDASGKLFAKVRVVGAERPEIVAVDVAAGKTRRVEVRPVLVDALRVEYDVAQRARSSVPQVAADWDSDGTATGLRMLNTNKTVDIPDGALVERSSLRWSPDRSRLAFATRPEDPCGESAAARVARLYVVDSATGRMRAIAAGEAPFSATWVQDDRLAYVHWQGNLSAVRLVQVSTGNQMARLEGRGGVATDWISSPPPCRRTQSDEDISDDVDFEDEDF